MQHKHYEWNISKHTCFFLIQLILILVCLWEGVSANADPRTYKLRTRVTNICGYRKRQPNRSAMEGPRPGETAWMITVFSVPGKYARVSTWSRFKWFPLQSLRVSGRNNGDTWNSEHHTIAETSKNCVILDTTSILKWHVAAEIGDVEDPSSKRHADFQNNVNTELLNLLITKNPTTKSFSLRCFFF